MEKENRPLTSIRGFAAFWVFALHLIPPSKGIVGALAFAGYTAVDLFFILSGLILALVYADLSRAGVAMFWSRRACRIFPLHIAATLALLAIVVLQDPSMVQENLGAILGSLLLVHPFMNMPPEMIANPPSWSIGVEMMCYLLFPTLIALFRPVGSRLVQVALLAALLCTEVVVQIAYPGVISGVGALLRGFVGFLIGMLLWRLGEDFDIRAPLLSLGEGASLVGLAVAALLGRREIMPLFAALLLFCLMFDAGMVARFLRRPTCLWLGRISFSIYLLHFVILYAAGTYFPARSMSIRGGLGRTLWEMALIATVLGLSALTYRYIEVPGRRIPGLIAAWKLRKDVVAASPAAAMPTAPAT